MNNEVKIVDEQPDVFSRSPLFPMVYIRPIEAKENVKVEAATPNICNHHLAELFPHVP